LISVVGSHCQKLDVSSEFGDPLSQKIVLEEAVP
jgi:hypothetical protein